MSEAAAEPVEDGEATPPALNPRRKKLLILIAAVLLVLTAAGGTATYIIKKRAAAAAQAEEDGDTSSQAKAAHDTHGKPPTFLPLEPFVVNLADRDTERFAQIGITLELEDPDSADKIKAYMPAIRNGILLVLAQKTSQQLLGRSGKEALATEILRESVRPLGLNLDEEITPAADPSDEEDEDAPARAPSKHIGGGDHNPIRRVHFSSFIIQ